MRSHLALIVVVALTGAACTRTLQSAKTDPCPAPQAGKRVPANGIGIIGMSLDRHPDDSGTAELFVDRVVPEGPAASAGVRSGDRIYDIEGTSTAGMSVAEAARRLRGPTGASIALRVGENGRVRDVTITRVAPSDLWNRAAATRPSDGERVHASDVAPAAAVAVPPCRQ
jgi:S1-C subfamily serine protease